MTEIPYEIGALYNRQTDIHGRYGGQQRGGISTPTRAPIVLIFTGEAGKDHGYNDFWDDYGVFHYFGEGQHGDMTYTGGNKAVLMHEKNGKALLLFQMMGHGRPCRYLGEFRLLSSYEKDDIPDTADVLRRAIVFRLVPIESNVSPFNVHELLVPVEPLVEVAFDTTFSLQLTSVRKKQSLFRRRLISVEKECRLTGIRDLRFLRASHIKPWAACEKGEERVDGNNGLLLCPQADLLFDQGWITFGEEGRLLRSTQFPSDVLDKVGLDLNEGRPCGRFKPGQQTYLEFHRNRIFNKKFLDAHQSIDAMIHDLLKASS